MEKIERRYTKIKAEVGRGLEGRRYKVRGKCGGLIVIVLQDVDVLSLLVWLRISPHESRDEAAHGGPQVYTCMI